MRTLVSLLAFGVFAAAPLLQAQDVTPTPAAATTPHKRMRKAPPSNSAANPTPQASAAPATATSSTTPKTTMHTRPTTAAAGGGNGQVWVNSDTHVYHHEGSRFYGKTQHGKYMNEQDAIKAGYHAAKGKD